MNTPLVSIVTPCLNPGWRLTRCLASVAAQTYPHLEHIVVDGGSTDETLALLESSKIRWISGPDSVKMEAMNKGFTLSSGAILSWLNADDVWMPDAVTRAVQALSTGAAWT